jgi:hypothetical protein
MRPNDLGVLGPHGHRGYLKGDKEEKAGLGYGMQSSSLHCTRSEYALPCRTMQAMVWCTAVSMREKQHAATVH